MNPLHMPAMTDRQRIFLVVRLLQEVKAKGCFIGTPHQPYDRNPDMVYGTVRLALRYLRHYDTHKANRLAIKIANRFKETA